MEGRSVREKRNKRKRMMFLPALLLSVAAAAICWTAAILLGGAWESHVQRLLDKTDYYEEQAECLEEQIEELSVEAGLPAETADGAFHTDEVLEVTRGFTAARLRGSDTELNAHAAGERVRACVYATLEAEGIGKESLQTEALEAYTAAVEEIYQQTAENGFVRGYYEWKRDISRGCMGALSFLTILTALCLFFIYRLCRSRHKTLSYTVRALEGAIVTAAVPAILGLTTGWYQRIQPSPAYLEILAREFVNGIFQFVLCGCAVLAVIALLCAFGITALKRGHRR